MNIAFPSTKPSFVNCIDCASTLARMIGNLNGFLYRRRFDARWTMEFVSAGCRDVTGYDPHRFVANASIVFADLVARSDWERVNERVRLAVARRHRATMEYSICTAYGAWAQVEDRFAPVINAAGSVLVIEGIIDRVRCGDAPIASHLSVRDATPSDCSPLTSN